MQHRERSKHSYTGEASMNTESTYLFILPILTLSH